MGRQLLCFALTSMALFLVLGCEFTYPWEDEPPAVQDHVHALQCGETLEGVSDWIMLDAEYPDEWNELCTIRWDIQGDLTGDYDHNACEACRCVYDTVATVDSDNCDWYGDGDEFDVQIGFTPTANGPSDYQDYASDWPWLVYTDFSVSWTEQIEFRFWAQDYEDALPGSYDAGELYLSSAHYWNIGDDGNKMVMRGWVGMSL